MWITRLKSNWHWRLALGIYHIVIVVVIWVNFPESGKFLTGWDALHPEFDFELSWQRSLYAVWQSNYGVGALVGHGFAALLPHTMITWLLSLFLPFTAIRPTFIFVCLYLGGLGMLLLLKQILGRLFQENTTLSVWVSLVASIFYLLNLGTIQQFYLPLEAFTVQFALFPWFFWSLNRLWRKQSIDNLLLFGLINFLGSIQGFIPVLFVAFLLVFIAWLTVVNLQLRNSQDLKTSMLALMVFILVNVYWLLPFAYYVMGNDGHFLRAYNNQLSTPEFVARSEAYGTLTEVVLLKSFYLDGEQPNGQVFEPWLKHIESGRFQFIGWGLFGLIVTGWGYVLWQKRDNTLRAYAVVGIIVFGFLATQVPPFSWYMRFLYEHSSLFEQMFRTSFTKFGLLLAGFYSIFLGIGLAFILSRLEVVWRIFIGGLTILCLVMGIVVYSWPVFNGHLFNSQLLTRIPDAYFKVMKDFQNIDDGRVAELPIECSEGWFSRDWGYYGSGFMWFGVPQSYLSRTFDVWSSGNERFYFEARYALRQPDYVGFDKVLEKYGVRYLYLDENLDHCQGENGLDHFDKLVGFLTKDARFTLIGEYPDSQLAKPLKVFTFSPEKTETINAPVPYVQAGSMGSSEKDRIYGDFGTYIEIENTSTVDYLFNENSFAIGQTFITTKASIPNTGSLLISSLKKTERFLPVRISLQSSESAETHSVRIDFLGPTVRVNEELVMSPLSIIFGPVTIKSLEDLKLASDNIPMIRVGDSEFIGTFFIGSDNNFVAEYDGMKQIWWSSGSDTSLSGYLSKDLDLLVTKGDTVIVDVPKVFDQDAFGNTIPAPDLSLPVDCSVEGVSGRKNYELRTKDQPMIRLITKADDYCIREKFKNVYPAGGYIVKLKTEHVAGLPLKFNLTNWREISYQGNYLPNARQETESVYVVPPVFDDDLNYTLELKNSSFGFKETVNDVKSLEYWFIPYEYVTSAHVVSDKVNSGGFKVLVEKDKKIEPFYGNELAINEYKQINLDKYQVEVTGKGLLFFSQGYEQGWLAFSMQASNPKSLIRNKIHLLMPWWFGEKLEHVKVNGWANGWLVPTQTTRNKQQETNEEYGIASPQARNDMEIVMVYWPQYLEWLGLGVLGITFGVLMILTMKKSRAATR